MLHACRKAIRVAQTDDIWMLIGWMLIGADRNGRLLEVGLVEDGKGNRIIHAMPARAKHLR